MFCVLRYSPCESVIIVQPDFRNTYGGVPPYAYLFPQLETDSNDFLSGRGTATLASGNERILEQWIGRTG